MPAAALRRRPVVAAAALLGALALTLGASASGAVAADGGTASVAHVERTDDGLQVLVSVPADSDVDLDGVSATVASQEAEATAVPAGTSDEVRRTAVLAIDTSNSMRGVRFEAAREAALQFIDAVPDDVYVGIVSFAGEVVPSLAPTLDRDAARATVAGLALSRETRLYDGVLAAVDMAGTEGQRSLLVLSDGADTTTTALEDVTAAIEDAEVLVDVVSLDQAADAAQPLQELAGAGDGEVVPADPEALAAAFAEEADILARQVLVTVEVPSTVTAEEATVGVSLPAADGTTLEAEAFTTVQDSRPSAPEVVASRGWATPLWMMYAGTATLGVGLLVALVLLVPRPAPPMTAEGRVVAYAGLDRAHSSSGSRIDAEHALAGAKDAAASVLKRSKSLDARITHRLEGAGSELKAAEWLLLHAAVFLVAGAMGMLIGKGSLAVGLVFLALGAVGPWLYLGLRRSRRRKAFNSQLPDTLQLMSGSLAAGLSLAQSVDTVVREGSDPMGSEFKRVLVETRLGVNLEDAMGGVAERFDSKDFAWVVMAIRIQRQVGGNLAELLDTVASTMREREYIRRQVSALAAEGKLSAWVLGLLPPLFMLYLLLANREYVIVMFQKPLGWLMLAIAGTILSVGVFWMSRLVKVEV